MTDPRTDPNPRADLAAELNRHAIGLSMTGHFDHVVDALVRASAEIQALRQDRERLDWFEEHPSCLLAHRDEEGAPAYIGRASDDISWPDPGREPWTDLRTAIDAARQAGRTEGEGR